MKLWGFRSIDWHVLETPVMTTNANSSPKGRVKHKHKMNKVTEEWCRNCRNSLREQVSMTLPWWWQYLRWAVFVRSWSCILPKLSSSYQLQRHPYSGRNPFQVACEWHLLGMGTIYGAELRIKREKKEDRKWKLKKIKSSQEEVKQEVMKRGTNVVGAKIINERRE